MATFGVDINTKPKNAGNIRGNQMEIACQCWFTSKGRTKPLMIKYKDDYGNIQTIRDIKVLSIEEKNYNGIPSVEYECEIEILNVKHYVKLIYFKEECRWILLTT